MLLSCFGSQVNLSVLIPNRPSLAKTKNVSTWLTCFAFVFISSFSRLRRVNFGHDFVFFLNVSTTTAAGEDTLLLKLSKVSPIIFESENEFMRATQVEDEVVKLMQNVGL